MGFFSSIFRRKTDLDAKFESVLGWPPHMAMSQDEIRTIAVMASRIQFNERHIMRPQLMREMQQHHLELVFQKTRENDGVIHDINQDSVICLFNAWLDQPRPALLAAQTAISVFCQSPIQIHDGSEALKVELSIAIDAGPMLRSSVGDDKRKAFVFFGKPFQAVDQLSRIATARILISEGVAASVREALTPLEWKRFEIR